MVAQQTMFSQTNIRRRNKFIGKYWPSHDSISVTDEDIYGDVEIHRDQKKYNILGQSPARAPYSPGSRDTRQRIDSIFDRARRVGCLLPDPLTETDYFHFPRQGRHIRTMEILTPFFNWLAWSGELSLLRSLRLLSRQSNLIASFSLRHISGVPTVPPEEADETNPLEFCDCLVPPPLPKTPIKHVAVEYAIGRELELMPQTSTGRTIILVKIEEHIDVGPLKDVQRIVAKVVGVRSENDESCTELGQIEATRGRRLEMRLYDPCYIQLDDQAFSHEKIVRDDTQKFLCFTRRYSAYGNFLSDKRPLDFFSGKLIGGQPCPLVTTPIFCRYFLPDRELASERGVSVLLWEPSQGVPLTSYAQLHQPRQDVIVERCLRILKDVLYCDGKFDNLARCAVVEEDGTVRINNWEGFRYWSEPWPDRDNDSDWCVFVEEETARLRSQLSAVGLYSVAMD
jgi:hypothetical protein